MAKTKTNKRIQRILPADPEGQNEDRAEWAMQAVKRFQKATGLTKADGLDTAIMDLLCDLAHLCDRDGLEIEGLLMSAAHHYREETDPTNGVDDDLDEPRGEQFDFLGEEN